MIIPSEYEFKVDCIGETTGKHYTGNFKYKFANIKTSNKIIQEVIKLDREMSEGKELDPRVASMNEFIATLKYCMVVSPDWFKDSNYGYDLQDDLPLMLIADEIKKFKEIREEALTGK